jgi:alkanesulfonate monooxygenase SsuD/methylene tetrahydromethanopterin reductase-like flavin-dependent oxidoreductase (luciferase family)
VLTGFGIDPDQGLSEADELRVVTLAAELGYESAWTNSGPDAASFERCRRWHLASGLPVGISAVPAPGQSPAFYADHASRLWEVTGGHFTLVVGSGLLSQPAKSMPAYLAELRTLLPAGAPLYLAALGPLMLKLGALFADGVALNWCSAKQVAWSKQILVDAAHAAGRPTPRIVEYIRTAVDPDPNLARRTVAAAAQRYLELPPYRRHFERMGVADTLGHGWGPDNPPSLELVSAIGAAGVPGATRPGFEQLATGLDLAIVRVLVSDRGAFDSARRVLEECRPRA